MTESQTLDPPSPPPHPIRIFLVVVDDSEEMRAALRYACNRARATGGRVALLRVIAPVERQHFAAIGELMEKEAHEEAETLLNRLAETVKETSGNLPSLYVREGNTYDALLALVSSEPSLSILIWSASASTASRPSRVRKRGRGSPTDIRRSHASVAA